MLLWPEVHVAEAQLVPGLTHLTAWGNQYKHNLPVAHPQHTGREVLNRILLLNYILFNCNLWGKNINSALLYTGFVIRQVLTTWWQRWLPALGFPYSQLSIQSRIKIASLLLVWNHRISQQGSDCPDLGYMYIPKPIIMTRWIESFGQHLVVCLLLWVQIDSVWRCDDGEGRRFKPTWTKGMDSPYRKRFCIPDKGRKQKPAELTVITAHYGACGYWKHHVSI